MEQQEWIMPLRDGTTIKIPANKVANINKKIENKEPIKMADRLILYQDIASGPKIYEPERLEPELLEGAANAFGTPILDNYGDVTCIWVKETVTSARWNKYYSQFAAYFKLGNSYDNVVIAYRLPVHDLPENIQRCNPLEAEQLEIKLANA